jgi:hypothetical protein
MCSWKYAWKATYSDRVLTRNGTYSRAMRSMRSMRASWTEEYESQHWLPMKVSRDVVEAAMAGEALRFSQPGRRKCSRLGQR